MFSMVGIVAAEQYIIPRKGSRENVSAEGCSSTYITQRNKGRIYEMTTIIENGKRYEIEDGIVKSASAVEPVEEKSDLIQAKDRVTLGNKVGTVVAITDSIYGENAVVKFDDGSVGEYSPTHLALAPVEKTAAVETLDGMEEEYQAYQDMPDDSPEELESKGAKARELNLRAKAMATNQQNALRDQILYDRIVTATAVDILDLRDAGLRATANAEEYLENQPRYRVAETISGAFGLTRGGDASWLAEAADSFEVDSTEDAELAQRASATIASFSDEQLRDEGFVQRVLEYSVDQLPQDTVTRDRFTAFVNESVVNRLSEATEENQRTASTVTERDLDGNDFSMEDLPVEALYGV